MIGNLLVGLGISGMLFCRDPTAGAVIDEDELITGIRREAGYCSMVGLMIRLSSILVFVSIGLVFNTVGWAIFNPRGVSEETILGLRLLMFVFPSIFLTLGLIGFSQFPITKEKYEIIKQKVEELHQQKKERIFG